MDKCDRGKLVMWIIGILVVTGILLLVRNVMIKQYTYADANEEQILYNPLIGYAPTAEWEEAVGKNTLVYIDILWSEIEQEQGVYDFSAIYEENHIREYKAQGKKAVFRFICDKPREETHIDIPQWLYEKTKDGTHYDISYGKGYSPNYANPVFMKAHEQVLQAIAKEFCQDNFFAYIELGSLGHWGEWHVKSGEGIVPIPTEAICMQYVTQYVNTFPDTRLLMRRPFLGVKEYGLGVFNDMTGHPEATKEWLSWLYEGGSYDAPADVHTLYANQAFYQHGAIGGEFTSSYSWKEMLSENFETTKELIQQSHMTFIGPMAPHEQTAPDYQKQADEIRELLGYRLGISKAVLTYKIWKKELTIDVTWKNQGSAPMYYDWPVYLYFYQEGSSAVQKCPVSTKLSQLMPGECMTDRYVISVQDWEMLEKIEKIGIGIEDPMFNIPSVQLNNATCGQDKITVLYEK